MKYSILVLGAPYSTQSMSTALRFSKALLKKNHSIFRVFFYHDAVNAGNSLITPPQDEQNIPAQWQALVKEHQLDLVVCIASALKRGVLNETEADRYEKPTHNLLEGFDISGLGQLVEAMAQSDRVVSFGA
ncbi:MAG: tRNA 2-thiouridine synthesizing protein D [Pseudohongiellaceae bacterium]|jgi:tRNA 2-thiouridine synthesizing protein D